MNSAGMESGNSRGQNKATGKSGLAALRAMKKGDRAVAAAAYPSPQPKREKEDEEEKGSLEGEGKANESVS
ncbi:hypothetical protein NPIL_680511 [Nephila pilipes]|uniref:Uncharacterized protein n=1 Tax=Nephila pilipes TaxID=299642 RepID=A0A8X6TKW9_NEPPI|nr:hypothetical protein NPIL_680511 [Nephila pilipes]